ncbi:MAG TPA: hypothetical protein VMT22_04745 [Terriglobales bacterium]|jgi:hypothetical protein|nr:hypothetical protein [Terriglobales bacterium]
MSNVEEPTKLQTGTLIRHKTSGYQGRIDGITEIKSCFTKAGALLIGASIKEPFQYRVLVDGESLRRIAPAEDLEILEGIELIACSSCAHSFETRPGLTGKAGGRCQCGAWICPVCLSCQVTPQENGAVKKTSCSKQQARKARKLAAAKKAR